MTVTMLRNEADIAETFVRYHARLVDRMLILDNGSTDGTSEILVRLEDEGLPIEIMFDPQPAFLQAQAIDALVRQSIKDLDVAFVLPLDGDEFLTARTRTSVRELLESLEESRPSHLEWLTYVPLGTDDASEPNPIRRISHRRKRQNNHDSKVVLPARFLRQNPDLRVSQGSHHLIDRNDERHPTGEVLSNLALAHYPIRNPTQARAKYLIGWLANLARPVQVLFDWYPFYNLAKAKELSVEDLTQMALHYNVTDKSTLIELELAPLDWSFIPESEMELKYTPADQTEILASVLSYSEQLASELSKSQREKKKPDLSDQLILQSIRRYETVDGWLSPREAIQLYRLSAGVRAHCPVICELGSWLGRASYVLAKGLDGKAGGRLYCVDPFDCSGDPSSAALYEESARELGRSVEEQFRRNMARLDVIDAIRIVKSPSQAASDAVPDELDLLYIDADHRKESVLADFELWSPKIRPGGWVAFHDVGAIHAPGPKEVVESRIVPDDAWVNCGLIDELFFAQKRS